MMTLARFECDIRTLRTQRPSLPHLTDIYLYILFVLSNTATRACRCASATT